MPDDGDGPDSVALVARDRAEDPAWFAEQVLAPFTELIATDLGPTAAATALAAEHAYVIEAQLDDPDDLGHVQAAWALAKCVCEEGAAVVIDVYAARAHLGSEVAALAPERAFDVMHEVTLFFDEQSATASSPRGRSACASSAAPTSSPRRDPRDRDGSRAAAPRRRGDARRRRARRARRCDRRRRQADP